ncbi:hypothetical protein [Azospirillum endophyticum]
MPLHHFAALTVINFLSFALDRPDVSLRLGILPTWRVLECPMHPTS